MADNESVVMIAGSVTKMVNLESSDLLFVGPLKMLSGSASTTRLVAVSHPEASR